MRSMPPKWKYQKPKKISTYDNYVHPQAEVPKTLKISNWSFEKNPYNDSLFSTSVEEEDGVAVDRIWSVWDFELKNTLKAHLKKKNPNRDKVMVRITRHTKDEEDTFTFEPLDEPKIDGLKNSDRKKAEKKGKKK